MKRWLLIAIIFLFLGVYIFFRSEYFSSIITPVIINAVKNKMDIDISIGRTSISILPVGAGMKNLKLKIPSAGEIDVDDVSVNISVLRLVFGRIFISSFRIVKPHIYLSLVPTYGSEKSQDTEIKIPELPDVIIRNGLIEDGVISIKTPSMEVMIGKFSVVLNANLKKFVFESTMNSNDIELRDKNHQVTIEHVDGSISLKKTRLSITEFNIIKGENRVNLSGEINEFLDKTKQNGNLKIRGTINTPVIKEFLPSLPPLKGVIDFSVNLKENQKNINYDGRLRYNEAGLAELGFGNVKTDFSGDLKILRFYNTVIDIAGGRVDADGRIFLGKDPGMEVRTLFKDVSFARLLDNMSLHGSHVESRVDGKAELSGRFSPFKLSGNVDVVFDNFRIMDAPYTAGVTHDVFKIRKSARVVAPILIDDKKVEMNGAAVYAGEDKVNANVHLGFDDYMKIEYESEHFPLAIVFPISDFDMKGIARLSGSVEGAYSNPLIQGNITLSDAGMMFFNFGNVKGRISFYDMIMHLDDLEIFGDDIVINGSGKIDFHNPMSMQINADIEYAELGRLLWLLGAGDSIVSDFSGATSGTIKLGGEIENLGGRIVIDMDSPSIYGLQFNSGSADIELRDNKVIVNELSMRGEPQLVYITGAGNYKDKWIKGDFILSSLQVGSLNAFHNIPLTGNFMAKGRLFVDRDGFSGTVDMLLDQTKFADSALNETSLKLEFSGWKMIASGKVFGNAIISSQLQLREPYNYSLSISFEKFDLKPLVSHYLSIRDPEGTLTGEFSSEGFLYKLDSASAKMKIEEIKIGTRDLYLSNGSVISVSYKNRALDIPLFTLKTGDSELTISGGRNAKRISDFTFSGDISLALIDTLTDVVTFGKGTIGVKLRIYGRDQELKSYGSFSIYNGTLGFKNFPALFENIDAEFSLVENMLLVDGFYAMCGGGEIGIYGGITLSGLVPQKYRLSANIFDVRLPTILIGSDEPFPGRVSGTIQFAGNADAPLLSGKLNVLEASYTSNINWQTKLIKIRTRKLAARSSVSSKFKLSFGIDINIPDSIVIKNNLASIRAGGKLSILGTLPDIYILGDVVLVNGSIFFQSEAYQLTSGLISFNDTTTINPYFDISGVTDKEDDEGQKYRITVNISGTLENTRINFTSDPPLSEKDILSLLRYGVRAEKVELAGITSSEVYSFGGQVLIGELMKKEEIRDILSMGLIDKVELHPYTSERGRTTTLLTLSKTFKDRFKLKYSTDVGGDTQYMFASTEYSFGKYVSLIGSWNNELLNNTENRIGNLGFDLSVHYEF